MAKTIGMQDVPTRDLVYDSVNVRHRTSPIGELEESVRHYGILEPLIVRKKGSKFAVVVGSRRFSAAKAVGLKSVPAIVKELTDEEAFIESAVENIQRETLDPADEVEIVERVHKIYENVSEVARVLDRSRTWVEDHLRVGGFIKTIREEKAKSSGARQEPISVPRDMSKIADIARAADVVYKEEPKKRAALFESLKDKPREQVERATRRLRAIAEEQPESVARRPVKEVLDEVMEPNRLSLDVEFSAKVSRGILKAARSRDVAEEDVVQMAVEDWLKREGFL